MKVLRIPTDFDGIDDPFHRLLKGTTVIRGIQVITPEDHVDHARFSIAYFTEDNGVWIGLLGSSLNIEVSEKWLVPDCFHCRISL